MAKHEKHEKEEFGKINTKLSAPDHYDSYVKDPRGPVAGGVGELSAEHIEELTEEEDLKVENRLRDLYKEMETRIGLENT
jgi:hypothetical protein